MQGKFDTYMRSIRSEKLNIYAKPTIFENINSTVRFDAGGYAISIVKLMEADLF